MTKLGTTSQRRGAAGSRYDFNIILIGDWGMDVWREGIATRLSPEAPVPVVLNPSLRKSLGLAGNAAANFVALGAQVLCLGVVGEDRQGEALFDACTREGLYNVPSTLTKDRGRLTTVKERVISDGHHVVRIDNEETHDIEEHIEDVIINQVEAAIAQTDGIIFSDYGKGVCTPRLVSHVMLIARENNVPVFVDPKKNLLIYKGATILKPNATEWKTHLDMCKETADLSGQQCEARAEYVVVTRGAEGMRIMAENLGLGSDIPAYKVPVHDRTGAGDTAMAVMALEYLRTDDIHTAVKLANFAGALAVQHSGTYRVTVKDLEHMPPEGAAIASVDEAAEAYVSATIDRLEKLGL